MRIAFAAAVVIDHDLEKVGLLCQFVVTPRGAKDRIERVDMFDVETDLKVLSDGLDRLVDPCEHLVFTLVEQAVPKDDFRILDEQAPELDKVAVARSLSGEGVLHEPVESAAFTRSVLVMLAKTRDARRGDALRVTRAERIQQRAVALIEKQDAVNVVRLAKVGSQSAPERAHVGMEKAQCVGAPTLQIHFRDFLHAGHVRAKHVFNRAKQFHAALLRAGQDGGEDVEVAMVGRAGLFQNCVPVKIRVRRRVIAAVESLLDGLLLAVVGKRMARNLPPAQPAAVGERRQENRVHRGAFLKDIEHRLVALVHKRDGADLDADHFRGGLGGAHGGAEQRRPDDRGRGGTRGCAVQELAAGKSV